MLGVAALFIGVGGENVRRARRVFSFLSSRVLSLIAQTARAVYKSFRAEGTTLADSKAGAYTRPLNLNFRCLSYMASYLLADIARLRNVIPRISSPRCLS